MCSTSSSSSAPFNKKSLLVPVNWDSVPVPEEIEDLEGFLDKTMFRSMPDEFQDQAIPFLLELLRTPVDNRKEFERLKIRLQKKHGIGPRHSDLLRLYRQLVSNGDIQASAEFEASIKRKIGKSHSGIVSITVVMGPGEFSCPMDCHFCPNDPSISRSYLLKEPAVRRGFQHGWDAYNQFIERASTLEMIGHTVTKVELLVLGGTFGSYPHEYAESFLRDCYYAANIFSGVSERCPPELREVASPLGRERLSIDREIEINQYARCAVIGVTLETRPDWINQREILRFRRLGATRIQLGIQHIDDEILDIVNRQCPTKKTKEALRLLHQNCYKVDGHFMPDLPGSSPERDLQMFQYLFGEANDELQVDQMKVYPCMTLDYTEILKWYKEGRYKPYAERNGGKDIFDLLVWICRNVPYHIRLNRIVRDMPHDYIRGGIDRVNMRQDLDTYLEERGEQPNDIRGREVKTKSFDPATARIFIDKYRANEGDEYFISFENDRRTTLYGFIRLRLSDNPYRDVFFRCLEGSALVRELHVYGVLVHQDEANTSGEGSQHRGIGRLLLSIAEGIAWEHGWHRVSIIAGIGVRDYYIKHGYRLEETFVIKDLNQWSDLITPPAHLQHHFNTQPTPRVVRQASVAPTPPGQRQQTAAQVKRASTFCTAEFLRSLILPFLVMAFWFVQYLGTLFSSES